MTSHRVARLWWNGPGPIGAVDRRTAPPPSPSAHPAGSVDPLDADRVARAARGDVEAVADLYDAHVDRVHRFVRFRVADPATAVDLTHDVFVAMLAALPDLRDAGRFGAWLMRIAHHRVVDHLTVAARDARLASAAHTGWRPRDGGRSAAESAGDDPVAGAGHDPRESVDRGLDAEAVLAQVRHLEADQQHVVALRFVADLSVAETAAVLGRSEDAVKKLQRRALANLRARVVREETGT